jgi:hypothetical protein
LCLTPPAAAFFASVLLPVLPVLAAKDAEWFEKIDSLTPADLVAVATQFTKQTVDKVQHGEQQQQQRAKC